MNTPVGRDVPSFSYRERFVIVLGIAVIVFSALGIFGAEAKVIFTCLLALCIVSVMVIKQVKELRKTAANLYESEERFRLLIEEVEDYAFFALDTEGVVASWNRGGERLTGYTAVEMIGKPFSELHLQDGTPPEAVKRMLDIVREKGRFKEEVWYEAKGGRRFLTTTVVAPLVSHGGAFRGFSVVCADITAKKEAEHQLLDSYRFIERITRTIPNIIFILDLQELRTVYVNDEIHQILGYTTNDVATAGSGFFRSIIHPDETVKFDAVRQRCESINDGEIVELDCRMKHARDDWRWLSCRIVVFSRASDGKPDQFLGIAQDVTALRNSLDETKKMERAAYSRQRLALLGELSAGVAHEIRNPLQGILGCVEDLRSQCNGNPNIRSTVELLEEGLQRMDHISARLLRLARSQDGEKAPTDVAQCIEGTFAFVRTRAQKSGLKLVSTVEPNLPLVPMYAERVSEALLNLLNNALDACNSGGTVSLSAERSKDEDGMLEMRVADSGSGIPENVRDLIFDAFFTTKEAGKGTGLGMTIVRKNIEAHGGRVELLETSAKGTVFRLLIPME